MLVPTKTPPYAQARMRLWRAAGDTTHSGDKTPRGLPRLIRLLTPCTPFALEHALNDRSCSRVVDQPIADATD